MYHPETMLRLVHERQQAFIEEAQRDRLVRQRTSIPHQERPDRFGVRDLRWHMFRPTGA